MLKLIVESVTLHALKEKKVAHTNIRAPHNNCHKARTIRNNIFELELWLLYYEMRRELAKPKSQVKIGWENCI